MRGYNNAVRARLYFHPAGQCVTVSLSVGEIMRLNLVAINIVTDSGAPAFRHPCPRDPECCLFRTAMGDLAYSTDDRHCGFDAADSPPLCFGERLPRRTPRRLGY